MSDLTFDQLPTAVSGLYTKLENIERNIERLLQLKSDPPQQVDQWLDLTELCSYLPDKPAKATVYSWVHSSIIPFHKRSKKLFFLRSEINNWLKEGRRQTVEEIKTGTDTFLNNHKKRS